MKKIIILTFFLCTLLTITTGCKKEAPEDQPEDKPIATDVSDFDIENGQLVYDGTKLGLASTTTQLYYLGCGKDTNSFIAFYIVNSSGMTIDSASLIINGITIGPVHCGDTIYGDQVFSLRTEEEFPSYFPKQVRGTIKLKRYGDKMDYTKEIPFAFMVEQ